MSESSVHEMLPVGSETSAYFRVVDLHFWYVETNLERLNTLVKAVFVEFVKIHLSNKVFPLTFICIFI